MRYFLFFILLVLISCQPQEIVSTLDFKIQNAKTGDKISLYGPEYEKELTLQNGEVLDTAKFMNAGVYTIIYGRNAVRTYVEPGDDIVFSGDAKQMQNTASFVGEQQSVWNYYKEKASVEQTLLNNRLIMQLGPDDFLEATKKGQDSLQVLLSTNALPKVVKEMEEEALMFSNKRRLFMYPAYADKDISTLSVAFQDPLKGIALDDEEKYINSQDYKQLVNDHFALTMYRDTTGEYEDVFMKHIAQKPAGNIRNQLLYNDMRYLLGPNENMDKMYDFFQEHSNDEKHRAEISMKYESMQSLRKGKDSPDFDYENHKGGTTKLADFKGKYVYVDVWATWCGPCKAEIPFLKEKEEKYASSNVEFVSISIDEKKAYDAWRKMVKDQELGGTQLIADNAWNSDFVRGYQITGIPRFILIDPDGKIVTADAPRPSSNKLDETFQKLKI